MRILHAHKYFHSRDGASRYERGLMRLQEEAGHVVAPFAMVDSRNEPTPWSEYFVSNIETQSARFGRSAFTQFGRAFWSAEAKKKMEKMLDVFRPDILHVHNIYTQLSPSILAAAKKRNIPIVMTVHDYALVSANYSLWDTPHSQSMNVDDIGIFATAKTRFIKNSFSGTLALELILKFHHLFNLYRGTISHFIVFSHFMANILISAGWPSSSITITHPFSEPLFSPSLKASSPIAQAVIRDRSTPPSTLLYAGRLEPYKGVHVLIDAMRSLPASTTLKIVGTGPSESALKLQSKNDPRIHFLGFMPGPDLWKLMAQSSAVIVPSIWNEPYGLVALEAMSQGTPVIVAKSGGLPEVVGDTSNAGIIVPPNNPKALAKAIQQIVDNPEKAQTMRTAAFTRAQAIGDPQAHLAKIMEIYSTVGIT